MGQNLFSIVFEDEDDLERIMEGPCPPECDKKDLMHAVGSTFGSVIRSEIKGEFCRLKVNLDVQKPLRRGHGVKDCMSISSEERVKTEDNLPYSIALKVESSIKGKKSIWLGSLKKKTMIQCNYTGMEEPDSNSKCSTDLLMPKTQIDMKMEKVSKKDPNVLEASDGEENNKFNDGIDSLGKRMTTVEEKLQKNQSSMAENQRDEMKENFDVNMSERILGKRKFNHEGLVENVTYPTNESPVKKAKANKDREDGYANFDCKQTVSHFQHVKRTENAEAHNLASEALKMDRHTDANHRHATTTLIGAGNNTSKNGQVVTETEVDRGWKRHL
ncbi:hypothetical protein PVK06_000797 [Gossypium arboreum]|uniref:Uncharacterized protein n=1 Tax=Gossypium arboreum TaxID=29729 RepID=A0ABR0R0M4_GOSAR|nr:hypothetical protein PVK06_000797 [Gossypium arboreum]